MYNKKNREKTIELRKLGWSFSNISSFVRVPRCTIIRWIKNIDFSEKQNISEINSKNNNLCFNNMVKKYSKSCKELRDLYYQEGKKLAIENKNNWDFIAGCMLYAAEGNKSGNGHIRISNCDIKVIKLVKSFLQKYFNTENKNFKIRFNYFENNNISFEDIKKYWLNNLGLKEKCLRKSTIKPNNNKKIKYPYGVCYLFYNNIKHYQQIMGAIDEIFSWR